MPMDIPPEIDTTEESEVAREICLTPVGIDAEAGMILVESLDETVEELWVQLQKEVIETGSVSESLKERFKSLSADSDTDAD